MLQWMLMPFRRYADFSGRSQRQEFWFFALFNWLLGMAFCAALGIVMLVLYFADMSEDGMMTMCFILIVPYILYSFYAFVPNLAVAVRRLHDIDKSGWHVLIGLIPLIGAIVLIVWYASEGTRGSNRYGPDPLTADPSRIFG